MCLGIENYIIPYSIIYLFSLEIELEIFEFDEVLLLHMEYIFREKGYGKGDETG